MPHLLSASICALAVLAAVAGAPPASAQSAPGKGTGASTGIICWHDKNGKQVGCGYSVPPEYANNPTRELNSRGLTVKKTEAAATAEAVRARQEEEARRKQDDAERAAAKKRDQALINSYTTESEIDSRRDREIAQIDLTILSLQTTLKQQRTAETELRRRVDGFAKTGKPAPDALIEELRRATSEVTDTERMIGQKRAEQDSVRAKYGELRARFTELTRRDAAPAK